jgi:hypothetical protein
MHFSHLSTVAATALVLFPSAILAGWDVTMSDHKCGPGGTQDGTKYGMSMTSDDNDKCWTIAGVQNSAFDAKSVYFDGLDSNCVFVASTDENRDCSLQAPGGYYQRFEQGQRGCFE